jgi:hypothetical protein
MGLFDTGIVTCPHCNEVTEEQTKSFDCCLTYFDLDAPIEPYIVAHFSGRWDCDHCKEIFYIENPNPVGKIEAVVTKHNCKESDNE